MNKTITRRSSHLLSNYFLPLLFLIGLAAASMHLRAEEAIENSEHASLRALFSSMGASRGAFGKNVQTHEGGRRVTGSFPSGTRLFQANFRGEKIGRPLVRNHEFFVANLFTTNYFEMMEKFIYGKDPDAVVLKEYQNYSPSRVMNHTGLINAADGNDDVMDRAEMVMRHWVLERYYVTKFRHANLAKSFNKWGAGDSNDEQIFASHWFGFLYSAMESDLQHLPAFLLMNYASVKDGSSDNDLDNARDWTRIWPKKLYELKADSNEMYRGRIRNIIHNQLTPNVLDLFREYRARKGGSLNSNEQLVYDALVSFYSSDPSKIITLATKLGRTDIVSAARNIDDESNIQELLALASAVADLRTDIATSEISRENKGLALMTLQRASQLLNGELNNTNKYSDTALISTVGMSTMLSLFYIEGLISKNARRFLIMSIGEEESERIKALRELFEGLQSTIENAFAPSLEKWKVVEPGMEHFIDDTMKASSANAAGTLLKRLEEAGKK